MGFGGNLGVTSAILRNALHKGGDTIQEGLDLVFFEKTDNFTDIL